MRRSLFLVVLLASPVAFGQQIANSRVTVSATTSHGIAKGFTVHAGGKEVARVELCDHDLITAGTVTANGGTLSFTGLTSRAGVGFGSGSRVDVSFQGDSPYPQVSFDLRLDSFDPAAWQKEGGKSPFHFLCIPMRDAEAFHTRGWLNATPLADPFPLLQDVHAGTPEISAYLFNRRWSNLVPLGAQPLPVIGLWSPEHSHYVGFDFQATRLADNSEKDIATGYYWGGPDKGSRGRPADQFVSLVYPEGGEGFQHLKFPEAGAHLSSRCSLLWSDDLKSTDDPNEFVYSLLWQGSQDILPRVPAGVDLSWLPGEIQLKDFPAPREEIFGTVGAPFTVTGTRAVSGWKWQYENPVLMAAASGDQAKIAKFESDAAQLEKLAKHFKANGDDCVFWVNPLSGSWVDDWGGKPVASLHDTVGFAAGRLFLGLSVATGKPEYRAIAEGVMNWAKHIAWTRNEYPDVPSSPFAIGGTITSSFCLEYYALHRASRDPAERARANDALRLARSFAYRYLTMWPSDNDRFDGLDSTFLWEPNSGRDWTGAACANEVFQMLDSLAQVAVMTGDEILMWAVQGSLSRWSVLYEDRYRDGIAAYRQRDMAEGYGLYPGNVYGEGARTPFGFSDTLEMIEPVGSCEVHVLAGDGSAMVFNKHGVHSGIRDYRTNGPGNFSFAMRSLKQSVDVTVTEPYADLSKAQVMVTRDGNPVPIDVVRPPQAPWSLILKGLAGTDRVTIGTVGSDAKPLKSLPPLTQGMQGLWIPPVQNGFQCLKLPYDAFPDMNWAHLDSWAGLPRGELWSYGVPFALPPNGGRSVLTKPARFAEPVSAASIAIAYSAGTGAGPALVLGDGSRLEPSPANESLLWRAWPPIFTQRLVSCLIDTGGKQVVGIDPGSRQVWAMTVAAEPVSDPAVLTARTEGANEWQQEIALQAWIDRMKALVSASDPAKVAFLPPDPIGAVDTLAHQSELYKRAKVLTPNDLVGGALDPKVYPVLVFAASEQYIASVKDKGDASESIRRYLEAGGTLVLAGSGPYPMYYTVDPGGRPTPDPLAPKLGLPIEIPFPTVPDDGLEVRIAPNLPDGFALSIKDPFPMPAEDPRLRSIEIAKIPPGEKYVPIASVVGKSGKSYGDAAGMVVLPSGGRILYVWSGLLADPVVGHEFTEAVLRFMLSSTPRAG